MKKTVYKIGSLLLFGILGIKSLAVPLLPMKFDKRIDGNGSYQEYQVDNPTNETLRYKIYKKPEPKDLTDKGIIGSMDKWIEFYPKILTIPPKSKGIVKVAIKAPKNVKQGEYAARVGTTPVAIPKVGENGETINAQISLPVGTEIQIFGYVGDIAPKIEGELKEKKTENGSFVTGNIKNTGSAGVGILASYRYKDTTGTHTKILSLGRIMPGQEIKVDTSTVKNSKEHKVLALSIKEDGGTTSFLTYT